MSRRAASKRFECPLCLGGQIEVALGQSVDLVRPDLHFTLSPGQIKIRVMPLGVRHGADFVDKRERLSKVLTGIEPLKIAVLV